MQPVKHDFILEDYCLIEKCATKVSDADPPYDGVFQAIYKSHLTVVRWKGIEIFLGDSIRAGLLKESDEYLKAAMLRHPAIASIIVHILKERVDG